MFSGLKSCGSWDMNLQFVLFFIDCMVSQDHLAECSKEFMGVSSLSYVITLIGFVTIGIMIVKI